VDEDGRARGRDGEVQIVDSTLPDAAGWHPRAIAFRHAAGASARRLALPADQVEGVVAAQEAAALTPPPWLARIDAPYIADLVRLETGEIAALLDLAELLRDP
jgi:chemotaxis signal transduction protein